MSWTTPRLWVAGELVTAAYMNTYISDDLVALMWPVGSIFTSVVSTNPATLLGYGTWTAFGSGRRLVGRDGGQAEFDVVEETGGAKTVTLTSAEMPAHSHTQDAHNHSQSSHNHTQDAHNHTQDAHDHPIHFGNGGFTGGDIIGLGRAGASAGTWDGGANQSVQARTATNQAATATNQATTATNVAATATNQNTGGGGSHSNLQPYIVVYFWKRTA